MAMVVAKAILGRRESHQESLVVSPSSLSDSVFCYDGGEESPRWMAVKTGGWLLYMNVCGLVEEGKVFARDVGSRIHGTQKIAGNRRT
jgi:hypothetical protein